MDSSRLIEGGVACANAVGSLQNQLKVLMNLKLKDPTNQNSSFQFEKNEAAAVKKVAVQSPSKG
jgi:hypothetical protein